MKKYLLLIVLFISAKLEAQTNVVTYAGNTGKETFYDVMGISNGTYLVCGYADNLNWINAGVPKTQVSFTGSNTEMFGLYKTSKGIIAVGRQTADSTNLAMGNAIPITNIPSWGVTTPSNESAILVYYVDDSLTNSNDNISTDVQDIVV